MGICTRLRLHILPIEFQYGFHGIRPASRARRSNFGSGFEPGPNLIQQTRNITFRTAILASHSHNGCQAYSLPDVSYSPPPSRLWQRSGRTLGFRTLSALQLRRKMPRSGSNGNTVTGQFGRKLRPLLLRSDQRQRHDRRERVPNPEFPLCECKSQGSWETAHTKSVKCVARMTVLVGQ